MDEACLIVQHKLFTCEYKIIKCSSCVFLTKIDVFFSLFYYGVVWDQVQERISNKQSSKEVFSAVISVFANLAGSLSVCLLTLVCWKRLGQLRFCTVFFQTSDRFFFFFFFITPISTISMLLQLFISEFGSSIFVASL